MRKSSALVAIVVVTLGIGIGTSAALFTLLDQVLLRRLPVRAPEEIVLFDGPGPFMGRTVAENAFSYPMYERLRDGGGDVFQGALARYGTSASFSHAGETERIEAELVSGSYFDVLGVVPLLGRPIALSDDRPGSPSAVVVLGHGFWTRRFGGDPSLLNQTVHVNGRSMTVVGVAPPGFGGVEVGRTADLFVPLTLRP